MKKVSHFHVPKSQRNGIFFLILFCLALEGLALWKPEWFFRPAPVPELQEEEKRWLQKADSLREVSLRQKLAAKTDTLYPFSAHKLTPYRAYRLGLSPEATDRLLTHISQGGTFTDLGQLQQVGRLPDSVLDGLKPYLKFPSASFVSKKQLSQRPQVALSDLNTASAADLQQVYGIGAVLSERIVAYRTYLGGFQDIGQLSEVYGLSEEVIGNIEQRFGVVEPPEREKADVNTVSLAQLSKVPYFNKALAYRLVSYRSAVGRIDSLGQLAKIKDFPVGLLDRIGLYLEVK